jgi:hypothetical protein
MHMDELWIKNTVYVAASLALWEMRRSVGNFTSPDCVDLRRSRFSTRPCQSMLSPTLRRWVVRAENGTQQLRMVWED